MLYKVNSKKYIGALTDKLYSFQARPWELNIIYTVDILDSLGSNIKVYIYGSEIKRILPSKNNFLNEEWISNKTRYFFDGLMKWRVNIPLMKKNNILVYISWIQAFYFFILKVWFNSFFHKSKNLIFLPSIFVDSELIITTKLLINKLGLYIYNKTNSVNINDFYLYYINPNFFQNLNNKKLFMFIGLNLRLESPILNIKLRKNCIRSDILYCSVGSIFNDNLNAVSLGLNINNLLKYFQGKLKFCSFFLRKSKQENIKTLSNIFFENNIMYLIGHSIINRIDNKAIFQLITKYNNNNNIISSNYNNINKRYLSLFYANYLKNNLHLNYIRNNLNISLNILYLNLTSILYEEFHLYRNINNISNILEQDVLYSLGENTLKNLKSNFTIFQGHHINNLNVDLILPSVTFLEKSSNFLDIQGNILRTNFILYPPIFARNDWSILNALYIYMINFVLKLYKINLPKKINFLNVNRFYTQINDIKKINFYLKKLSINFYFQELSKYKLYAYNYVSSFNNKQRIYKIYNNILYNKYYNYYTLDLISVNSPFLKKSAKLIDNLIRNYINIDK